MSRLKRIGRAIRRWLDRLGEEDKKQFRSTGPSCCGHSKREGAKS